MSTIANEFTTDIRERKLQKSKVEKPTSFFGKLNIKGKYENHKLAKIWAWRNYDHGEVFVNSLEVDQIHFDQNIFVEDTKELSEKLKRLGFVEQVGFPDEELFKNFSRVMFNRKHNIAITMYQSQYKSAIEIAYNIMEKSHIGGKSALTVFVSAVEVLTKN